MSANIRYVLVVMFIAMISYLGLTYFSQSTEMSTETEKYTFAEVQKDAGEGRISSLDVVQNAQVPTGSVIVTFKDGSDSQTVPVTDVNKAVALAEDNHIPCRVEDVKESGGGLLSSIMPWMGTLLVILLMFLMINRMSAAGGGSGKMMNFGKSRARIV